MIYLSGCHNEHVWAASLRLPLGLLVQPNVGYDRQVARYRYWAADNGCFSQGDKFSMPRFVRWLKGLRDEAERCLFVTAPDVVGDTKATLRRSRPALEEIRSLGYPAALVGQDGLEGMTVPWETFDAFFLGGSTEWKLSQGAERLARAARERGKFVHCGRLNSERRLRAATLMGCHSADGTMIAFGPEANLAKLERWLGRLETEPFLPGLAGAAVAA